MRIVLFIGSVLSVLIAFAIIASAKSAIHEIQAFIMLLISAVLFSGAGIVEAVRSLEHTIMERNVGVPRLTDRA